MFLGLPAVKSEYEILIERLHPLLGDMAPSGITAKGIAFLACNASIGIL
jgi:hypothetical protein